MSFFHHSQRVFPQNKPTLEFAVKNAQTHDNSQNELFFKDSEPASDSLDFKIEEEVVSLTSWMENMNNDLAKLNKEYQALYDKINSIF